MDNNVNLAMKPIKVAPPEARSVSGATVGKRFGAALIDAGLFLLLFFGLNLAVMAPIMNAAVDLDQRVEQTNVDMKNSSLYVVQYLNAKKELIVSGHNLDLQVGDVYTPTTVEPDFDYTVASFGLYYPQSATDYYVSDLYPEMIYRFYNVYRLGRAQETNASPERAAVNQVIADHLGTTSESALTWYKTNVLKVDQADSYFITVPIVEPDPQPRHPQLSSVASEEVTSSEATSGSEATSSTSDPHTETIADFTFFPPGVGLSSDVALQPTYQQLSDVYTKLYQATVTDFSTEPDHVQTTRYQILTLVVPFLLASGLVYLLFPLLLKHGATLGKYLLKLGVVNTYGFTAKWWQHTARYFALFIFELMLTLLMYFLAPSMALLPIFLSFTMVMFGKKHRALHDFVAGTQVINLRTSLVYASAAEEDELNPVAVEVEVRETKKETPAESESFADRLLTPPPAPVEESSEKTTEEE